MTNMDNFLDSPSLLPLTSLPVFNGDVNQTVRNVLHGEDLGLKYSQMQNYWSDNVQNIRNKTAQLAQFSLEKEQNRLGIKEAVPSPNSTEIKEINNILKEPFLRNVISSQLQTGLSEITEGYNRIYSQSIKYNNFFFILHLVSAISGNSKNQPFLGTDYRLSLSVQPISRHINYDIAEFSLEKTNKSSSEEELKMYHREVFPQFRSSGVGAIFAQTLNDFITQKFENTSADWRVSLDSGQPHVTNFFLKNFTTASPKTIKDFWLFWLGLQPELYKNKILDIGGGDKPGHQNGYIFAPNLTPNEDLSQKNVMYKHKSILRSDFIT